MTEAESVPWPVQLVLWGSTLIVRVCLAFMKGFYTRTPLACPLLASRGLSPSLSSGMAFQNLPWAPQRVRLGEAGPRWAGAFVHGYLMNPSLPPPLGAATGTGTMRVGPLSQFPGLSPAPADVAVPAPFVTLTEGISMITLFRFHHLALLFDP